MPTVRVELPFHLRTLAKIEARELDVDLPPEPTIATLLLTLDALYPALRGTIRDHGTSQRRAYLRFFADQQDLSFDSLETRLPECVLTRKEPFLILGAVAGGCCTPVTVTERSIQS